MSDPWSGSDAAPDSFPDAGAFDSTYDSFPDAGGSDSASGSEEAADDVDMKSVRAFPNAPST